MFNWLTTSNILLYLLVIVAVVMVIVFAWWRSKRGSENRKVSEQDVDNLMRFGDQNRVDPRTRKRQTYSKNTEILELGLDEDDERFFSSRPQQGLTGLSKNDMVSLIREGVKDGVATGVREALMALPDRTMYSQPKAMVQSNPKQDLKELIEENLINQIKNGDIKLKFNFNEDIQLLGQNVKISVADQERSVAVVDNKKDSIPEVEIDPRIQEMLDEEDEDDLIVIKA